MKTTSRFLLPCLFCLALSLLSGCGNKVAAPKLTPAEQAEVDKYITVYGRGAIMYYLKDVRRDTNDDLVLKYVQYFVSQGADVNAKNIEDYSSSKGRSPLHFAVRWGKIELIKFLVSQGADVNAKDNYGNTPLHLAVESVEIAKLLVSKGADVNAKDDGGDTPLHVVAAAVYKQMTNIQNVEADEFLVSQSAEVNAKDNVGNTPIHEVAATKYFGIENVEAAEFLVSKGADVNARNNRGKTPIDVAREKGNLQIVGYLISQGGVETVRDIKPSHPGIDPFGSDVSVNDPESPTHVIKLFLGRKGVTEDQQTWYDIGEFATFIKDLQEKGVEEVHYMLLPDGIERYEERWAQELKKANMRSYIGTD